MNAASIASGWALPLAAALPVMLVLAGMLAFGLSRLHSWAGRYVLAALWLRFALDAFPTYTLRSLGGVLTWNAVASVAMTAVGLLVIRHRHMLLAVLVPLYLLLGAIALSSFMNGEPFAMVEQGAKFGLLLCFVICTYEAANEEGVDRFAATLLIAFLVPLAMQALSIGLGIAKVSDSDGSASYVGGFLHESGFSISVAAGLVPLALLGRIDKPWRLAFLVATLASLLLANYRTTIIALVPLLLYLVASIPVFAVRRDARILVASTGALLVVLAMSTVNLDLGPRFQSVVDFVSKPDELIQPLDTFTLEEQRQASARSYVWSMYVDGFQRSSPLQQLVGHGPDSWEDVYPVYAQNTILSYMYEFGWIGAGCVLLLWGVMMLPLFRVGVRAAVPLLLLHFGFLILNLSTQPFWLVEGLMMYGMICGLTLHFAYRRSGDGVAPAQRRLGGAVSA
ncbi:O-antigen ligase family protein [Stakelama saccharophila]|uniref:O-antigen ligase n=1 Tax=Stakelama saccharophila TaxID=3075605 RepID=A0ABZ0BB50_9SPHN|nr:hypothetical protein [Stakelama sp. W311]WNO54514.1 hypothetical protein RPR59_04465 [Stakelama sp. W311]